MNQSIVPHGNWHRVELRLTHRYVPEYMHLDKWANTDTLFKETVGREHHGHDLEESVEFWVYITFTRPMTKEQVQAFAARYSQGCACEYDCCGHYHGGAYTHRARHSRNGKRWRFPVSYSRNY